MAISNKSRELSHRTPKAIRVASIVGISREIKTVAAGISREIKHCGVNGMFFSGERAFCIENGFLFNLLVGE